MLSADVIDRFAASHDTATSLAQAVTMLSAEVGFDLADAYRIQRAGIGLRKLRASTRKSSTSRPQRNER